MCLTMSWMGYGGILKAGKQVFDLACWGTLLASLPWHLFMAGCLHVAWRELVLQSFGKGHSQYCPPNIQTLPKAAQRLMLLSHPLILTLKAKTPVHLDRAWNPTQLPPMAATLLPLTHHPKHYHKVLPCCQATHTVELTVPLCSARPCKDSSVWGEKVELVQRSKRLVMMAFYTRRENLLWCVRVCGLW